MKYTYLKPKAQDRLNRYNRLLAQFNNNQLDSEKTKELIKLSALIISELVKDSSKTKKISMMDSEMLRTALKNTI